MSEEVEKQASNWLKLTPNLEHFDPFEGLTDGMMGSEETRHIRYGFLIAGQSILIDQTIICEVVQNSYIYPIPNTPAWITGMVNLRGNLIPVFNLGRLFSGDKEYAPSRKNLLVIDRGERAIATFIDELPVSLDLEQNPPETVEPDTTAADLVKKFCQQACRIGDSVWYEIDHDALFKNITTDINRPVAPDVKQAESL